MHNRSVIVALLAAQLVYAQVGGDSTGMPKGLPPTDLPSSKLTFSEPKLDSPLDFPTSLVSGSPICGPDGQAFLHFLTSPPMYSGQVIASISPNGKVVKFSFDHIVGLTQEYVVSMDPGVTMPVMLLRARQAANPRTSPSAVYMVLFNYDGEMRSYSKLDLGFQPVEVAQVSDNSFLIIGADRGEARVRFVLTDSDGTMQRNLDAESIIPSGQLMNMVDGINIVGIKPSNLPPSERVGAVLSLLRPIHYSDGLLTLEPGANSKVFELKRSGETKTVKLTLPKNQIADSLLVARGRWFVRAYLRGTDDQFDLYEVDPESGRAIGKIDTSGVPPTSIACPYDAGFFGFRWVDEKPYLILGEMR